jgi:hypothetical protein
MDLNVSPDLEAVYCYGIVLLLGALVARKQVQTKLGNLPGAWIMAATWFLFFVFTLVPVSLFWLLDRTGAIHDTSLFAALLVAVGYQQILTGSLNTLKVSGEVSAFWQHFAKWTDKVNDSIVERVRRNDSRFRERVIGDLAKDEKKLDLMRHLVLSRCLDPSAVGQELDTIRSRFQAVSDESSRENEAKVLYDKLRLLVDKETEFLMFRRKITDPWAYYWFAREWRSKALAFAVGLTVIASAFLATQWLVSPENEVRYYAWRLTKVNSTPADTFRASRKLLAILNNEKNERTSTLACDRLSYLLREPDLPVGSIDQILGLLVENPSLTSRRNMHTSMKLTEALRAANPDARARIHSTLLHLAKKSGLEGRIPQDLMAWKPTLGNSITDLDQYIETWRKVFAPVPSPAPGGPAAAH